MPKFSKGLEYTIHKALTIATQCRHTYASLEHLLVTLIEDPDAKALLEGCHVDTEKLRDAIIAHLAMDLELSSDPDAKAEPTVGFQRTITRAALHVESVEKTVVTGADVLMAMLLEEESFAAYFLQEYGLSRPEALSFLSHGHSSKSKDPLAHNEAPDPSSSFPEVSVKGHSGQDLLEACCLDLTQRAREGAIDPLIGREEELSRMIHILCRRRKNNPLLIGDPGVGKTALAEGLAQKIVSGEVPEPLKDTALLALDVGALLAGTRYRGDFEGRFKNLMHKIEENPSCILFIDEIHTLVGAGATSGGTMDASHLLKPFLSQGRVRCIGATTYQEFRHHLEKDSALIRRFQKIDIHEPSLDETIKILTGLKPSLEAFHHVPFTSSAIETAARLASRYLVDKKLPDKALDVMDEAGAAQRLLPDSKKAPSIGIKEIEKTVAMMARIPPKALSKDDTDILKHLDADLKKTIFGQDLAISHMTQAIKLARAGLREPEKPMGSYLFSGPTGVGKTEVAKQLAVLLKVKFLRFDMSEYMERHSVSRLIGAPPGYVGFEQGGLLTDAIDQNPYAVVLLDEIEKAHPDLFNLLLQVMDHGRLTDHRGKEIDCRHIFLIMTTNAGAQDLAKPAFGFRHHPRTGDDQEAITRLFTPEFRNRLDAIIPFSPLSKDIVRKVVDKFMEALSLQLKAHQITLSLSEEAADWLAQAGYDETMGARPMARVIQDHLKKPLSEDILFGVLKQGGHVEVFLDPEKKTLSLTLTPKTRPSKIKKPSKTQE